MLSEFVVYTDFCGVSDGYDYGQADSDQGNYYRKISEAYSDCHAITTNYTPFVEHYFAGRNTYLAGRLSEFEFPCELSVKDIREYTIDDNAFVFPFLMTQAPVKPIITPSQILEYGEFLQKLNMADTLVIIGYSLCQEDNHINAMLHQFVVDKGKRIIYCYYQRDNEVQEQSKIRETVCERLRLEEDCNNLEIVQNTGDADELLEKISHLLKEESAHV